MKGSLGLTHLQIAVKDVPRSLAFYTRVLGMVEKFREGDDFIFLSTPGSHDIFTLNGDPEKAAVAGAMGGVQHFGFLVPSVEELERIVARVVEAGGKIKRRGDHDGEKFAYVADPDGYEIELYTD